MLNWRIVVLMVLLGLLVACGEDNNTDSTTEPTVLVEPTVEVVQLPTDTPGGPTLTPSSTFPPTPTLLPTDLPPAERPTLVPTDTPPPYIIEVQEGDTCGSIAVRMGLDLQGGSLAIRQANNLNERCTNLPGPGNTVIVPRPSLTRTPEGFDITSTAIATSLPPSLRDVTPFWPYEYCPVEGDTLTNISLKNGTTNQRLCELNPLPDGIDCSGCDFSESSVGSCPVPPLISTAKCLTVPGPTPTPTATATFTGDETPTPTPTYIAPRAVLPTAGETVIGPAELIWLSVRLKVDEFYVVTVVDAQSGEGFTQAVKSPNLSIPSDWQPVPGQQKPFQWSVYVGVQNPQTGIFEPVSGRSPLYEFIWQG